MKKRYVLLVIVIISVVIFNVPKSYANNKLDSIELKENNDINKKTFAMYIENSVGKYEPYTGDNNYFPNSLKYHYNESMSKCVDSKEEVVDGILEYNSEDNSVTVTSNKTVYCYLYFDLDKEKPILTEFTINEEKEYTNINPTNIKLTWSDEDINEYCISKTNSNDNCEWQTIEEIDRTNKTKTIEYELSNGLNNLYAYIKDLAGNVSDNINKNITLDTSKPGVPTVTLGSLSSIDNNYTNAKNQTVTVTYTDNDVDSYCISLNDTCTNYVTTGLDKASKKITISNYNLGIDGSKTIKVWLKDMAGNISETPGSITKTLDTTINDIKTISTSNVTNSKITSKTPTVTITWDDGDIDSYCIGSSVCTPSTKYSATNKQGTSSITLSEGANTIHAKIKDKAGNISKDKTLSVTVDTTPPTLNITGNTINETSIVLTYTASDASGITSITCDKPSGVTCSCTGTTGGSCTYSNLTAGTNYNNTLKIIAKDGVNLTATKSGNYTTKDNSASSYIEKLSPLGLNKTIKGGMYRFQGDRDSVNNYICFGTNDKATCTGDKYKYMYRIIGIVKDATSGKSDDTLSGQIGALKIIKDYTIDGEHDFHSWPVKDPTPNIFFSQSLLKKQLNGEDTSKIYLDSSKYNYGTSWTNKMISKKWYDGADVCGNTGDTLDLYNIEHGISVNCNGDKLKPSTESYKVALLVKSDFSWAYEAATSSERKKTWINGIKTGAMASCEWTMSRYKSGTIYYVDSVCGDLSWVGSQFRSEQYARPVFYLDKSIIIKSGTGSESDPFIIQV